jgi:carbonic anhydrase
MNMRTIAGPAPWLARVLSGRRRAPPDPPKPEHGAPHWGYSGEAGPAAWGKLSPEFSACAAGRSQSPIDIGKTSSASLPELRAAFGPAELKIVHHEHVEDAVNNGHTIQVNYTDGDTLAVGDARYELVQYHFHAPSEHTVGGKRYPMEMHLVHKSAAGTLAVIGVLIEQGAHNAAFDPVCRTFPRRRESGSHLSTSRCVDDRSDTTAIATTAAHHPSLLGG